MGGMTHEEARNFLRSIGYTEKQIQKAEGISGMSGLGRYAFPGRFPYCIGPDKPISQFRIGKYKVAQIKRHTFYIMKDGWVLGMVKASRTPSWSIGEEPFNYYQRLMPGIDKKTESEVNAVIDKVLDKFYPIKETVEQLSGLGKIKQGRVPKGVLRELVRRYAAVLDSLGRQMFPVWTLEKHNKLVQKLHELYDKIYAKYGVDMSEHEQELNYKALEYLRAEARR